MSLWTWIFLLDFVFFLPNLMDLFIPAVFCISSQFCLYFFPNWFAFLPIFVCISSQFEAGACQRCKPDGSFHSHWEEIQDHQIIKSQTLKLVSEEDFPQHGAALAGSSLSYYGEPMMSNPIYCMKLKIWNFQLIRNLVPSTHVFLRSKLFIKNQIPSISEAPF